MAWLGLDVGTTAAKTLLVDSDGRVLGRTSSGYEELTASCRQAGEQDPARWIGAIIAALRLMPGDELARVGGVGIVGQTPTLTLLDEMLQPVRSAITWQDARAKSEAAELSRVFGDPNELVGTNLPWSPVNNPAKLLWLSRHEPDVVSRSRWIVEPKDYVGSYLTGRVATDCWSSKGIVDVRSSQPVTSLLDFCGWQTRHVPEVLSPWDQAGAVTVDAARELRIPPGVPVAVGWSDACAGMLPLGVLSEPAAFIISGT